MLTTIDWTIIISFLLLSLGIGIYFKNEAGKSITDFFLGGRNLPWYVAGISMVATTFAADTPLAVSELVSQGGVAKNWLWWSFIFGGAATTFFFAMLWRRSGVLTELELIELRYEGKAAFYLRLFKAGYLGLMVNAIIIAWVNLAMMSLIEVFFEVPKSTALIATIGMMILAMSYSALSGLKGVAVTDAIQFVIAMVGCVILAFMVVRSPEIGGIAALKDRLPESTFAFFPTIGAGNAVSGIGHGFGLTIGAFFAFVTIQWWASWYPGSEPGGGGYIAQRMMSTRKESDAVWATMLFQIGHYCIRPWPWIIVGICAIALYTPTDPDLLNALSSSSEISVTNSSEFFDQHPELNHQGFEQQVGYHFEPRLGFVYAMRDFLPSGLTGLLLVAFIAAYLSTISTQINWGASYVVNDLILPLQKERNEKRLVGYSRLASVGIMILGATITPFITSISGVWEFILQSGAGLGLVLILRWYWWRINAWSEISASIAPLVAYMFCEIYLNEALGDSFTSQYGHYYFTVAFTTIVWLVVTFLTKAPSEDSTERFYQRVHPMGIWPTHEDEVKGRNSQLKWLLLNTLSMIVIIISALFLIGSIVLFQWTSAFGYFCLLILSIFGLRIFLKKTNIFERNSRPR